MYLFSANLLDNLIRRRAPKGMLYQIEAIHLAITVVLASNYIRVKSDWVRDISDQVSRNFRIADFDTTIAGNYYLNNLEERTKFITVGKSNAGSLDAEITFYGKLVKGTKVELIMEWFRKVR